MYTPAFLEIFVGLVVIVLWSRWLRDRPGISKGVVAALPWVGGAAVLLGQVAALAAILSVGAPDATLVRLGRWGSFGVVAGCAIVQLAMTVWSFAAARKA